jgi:ABC-type uncharacterized transport system fused permease/ATPase subunit
MVCVAMVAYMFPINTISRIFYLGQCLEGEFRAVHTRSILNAEAITFYNGQAREAQCANQRFERWHLNNLRYYKWQGMLMFLRLVCAISQPSVGYMMLAISGANDNSYATAFLKQMGNVLEYFLYLPAIIARLAFAAGAVHRVGQLFEAIDDLDSCAMHAVLASHDHAQILLHNIVASPPEPIPIMPIVGLL